MTRTTRCTTHHGQRVDSQVREAQFIEMTPGLAEWLLGMNTHNRKVKRQSIASLFAATAWSLPQRRLTPCGSQ